jgi:hypothetical protein
VRTQKYCVQVRDIFHHCLNELYKEDIPEISISDMNFGNQFRTKGLNTIFTGKELV